MKVVMLSSVGVIVFTLLVVPPILTEAAQTRYDGCQIHRIFPDGKSNFGEKFVEMGLDVWKHAKNAEDDVITMVCPDQEEKFDRFVAENQAKMETLIENIQKDIDDERTEEMQQRRKRQTSTSLLSQISGKYLSFHEIKVFLADLNNHPGKKANVEITNYGTTPNKRPLKLVKISRDNSCRPAILIDGGFHAREWISPATTLRFIYELVFNTANAGLVDKFDWYIIPVMNPDGYYHSRHSDRMWRKTYNTNSGSNCKGTDPNRNFGYKWNPNAGASTNPCSEVYAGPRPFSVPETTALSNLMKQLKDKVKLYLTVHSFGQFFLYPYGYSRSARAPDYPELVRLAKVATSNMKSYSYRIGSSGPDFSVAAGGSDDYAKGAMNIKYSYTMELPENSFVLSPSKIPKVAGDAWKGVAAMALDLSKTSYGKTVSCKTPAKPTTTTKSTTTTTTTTARPVTQKPAHACCIYMEQYKNFGVYYSMLKDCCTRNS